MAKPAQKSSPFKRLRDRLFVSCEQPIRDAGNLWLVYSARADRQWVLRGDLHYLHFLEIEFAREVREVDFAPPPCTIEWLGSRESVSFDAVVIFRDGRKECRVFSTGDSKDTHDVSRPLFCAAAASLNGTYARVSIETINPHRRRIQNTMRLLRFISAARRMSLVDVRNAVLSTLMAQSSGLPLCELAQCMKPTAPALVYAAVFQLVQRGRVDLDIDRETVTGMSLVRIAP